MADLWGGSGLFCAVSGGSGSGTSGKILCVRGRRGARQLCGHSGGRRHPQGAGEQLFGVGRVRGGDDHAGVSAVLYGALHPRAGLAEKSGRTDGAAADASADDHIWLCDHVFLREAGASHKAVRAAAVRYLRL